MSQQVFSKFGAAHLGDGCTDLRGCDIGDIEIHVKQNAKQGQLQNYLVTLI